jgi:hypothetical protein
MLEWRGTVSIEIDSARATFVRELASILVGTPQTSHITISLALDIHPLFCFA